MRRAALVSLCAVALLSIGGFSIGRGRATSRTRETPLLVLPSPPPPLAPKTPPARASMVGVLLASLATDVSPRYEGRLRTVDVRLGDHVDEGARLASIEVNVTRFDVPKARAALRSIAIDEQRARASAAQEADKLARTQRLFDAKAVREEDLVAARFAAEEARLKVEGLKAERAARSSEVARLTQVNAEAEIRAPFAGVVARRYVDPGASVSAVTPLVRLVGDGRRFVRFAAPETIAPRLRIGDVVAVELAAGATRAVVDRIAPEVDGVSRMVVVEAALAPSPATPFVVGEMVRVREAGEASR